jgi:hypothetical protein
VSELWLRAKEQNELVHKLEVDVLASSKSEKKEGERE